MDLNRFHIEGHGLFTMDDSRGIIDNGVLVIEYEQTGVDDGPLTI